MQFVYLSSVSLSLVSRISQCHWLRNRLQVDLQGVFLDGGARHIRTPTYKRMAPAKSSSRDTRGEQRATNGACGCTPCGCARVCMSRQGTCSHAQAAYSGVPG